MTIKENIQKILEEISQYPQKVRLVAVTKNRTIDEIKQVIEAGITDIAENKVQEAEQKILELSKDKSQLKNVKFHLIGHLQSNKVKKAVEIFDIIQSVDSLELLQKINKEASKQNKIIDVLLQVNIFEDTNKYGFSVETIQQWDETKLGETIRELSLQGVDFKNINITGLMTIAKQGLTEIELLNGFKKLKSLISVLSSQFSILSVGMSNDYKIALKAGSNMIRIGHAIFD